MVSPGEDLQKVFDQAPESACIRLLPGDYRQKVIVRTKGLTIIGSGADCTRIVWDDYAKKRDQLAAELINANRGKLYRGIESLAESKGIRLQVVGAKAEAKE